MDWRDLSRPNLSPALSKSARRRWRSKKLTVLVSLAVERPVLYADADILFFRSARDLTRLTDGDTVPRYLRDCEGRLFLDRAMLRDESEARESVNSGFIFLPERPDWAPALRRLEERLESKPALFAEQTVVHLTLHSAGARRFEPARYVVADDDRRLLEDRHVGPDTVLRHYVSPVRHKFWLAVAAAS